jgi:glycosyltransferase involved in cell wall biosynthesis
MNQKKILHFHPNEYFSNKFIRPLINSEKTAGFDSKIVNSIITRNTRSIKIKYNIFGSDLLFLPVSIYKICILFLKYRPNIVICHNSTSSFLPLLLSRLFGIERIIYFNHGVPYISYKFLIKSLLKIIERLNLILSKEVITVSKDMRSILKKFTKKKINLIHNGSCCGIDIEEYVINKCLHRTFRRNNNIKNNDTIVTFIGRPVERKGYKTVLNLWVNKFKNHSNFKLIICGSQKGDALKIISSVPKNITFMGFVNNIPEILNASDILILPSKHEGLSYVCLEAMASNCVVIANNIPGIRCLIENGKSGILVNQNRINYEDQYYKNILLISKNIKIKKSINENAKKTIKNHSRINFLKYYLKFIKNS